LLVPKSLKLISGGFNHFSSTYISDGGPGFTEGVTRDVFLRRLCCEHAAVAALAFYLCQAQTYVLFSVKKQLQCKTGLTNQRGNIILYFF